MKTLKYFLLCALAFPTLVHAEVDYAEVIEVEPIERDVVRREIESCEGGYYEDRLINVPIYREVGQGSRVLLNTVIGAALGKAVAGDHGAIVGGIVGLENSANSPSRIRPMIVGYRSVISRVYVDGCGYMNYNDDYGYSHRYDRYGNLMGGRGYERRRDYYGDRMYGSGNHWRGSRLVPRWRTEVVGYIVTYEYKGKTYRTEMRDRPGKYVEVHIERRIR